MVGTKPARHHRCVLATLGAKRRDFSSSSLRTFFNASQLRVNNFKGLREFRSCSGKPFNLPLVFTAPNASKFRALLNFPGTKTHRL
jgi:hypothetical protein